LLSIRGTFGRVCRVPNELDEANITQDTARLSIHESVDPEYILAWLKSPSLQDRLGRSAKGAAVRGVNIGDVRALQVALPPLEEQHEIVRRVDALFRLADTIEARVAAATARADKITQAILAKAFRGELVPTEAELARQEGRDYEPASTLLARIRTERTASEAAPKPARRPRVPATTPPPARAKPARHRTNGRTARSR
jgi:type I restriction enzyme S subunit